MKKIIIVIWAILSILLIFLLQQAKTEYKELSTRLNEMAAQCEKALDKNEQLATRVSTVAAQLTEKNNQIKILKKDIYKLSQERQDLQDTIKKIEKEQAKEQKKNRKQESQASRSGSRAMLFKATAYDLSVNSCGKPVGSKGYGITANGTNLSGKSREQAMTVAVDPKVIKLGSKLKITFPKPYEHFSGIYTANDTGGAIKGNKIDVFMGDYRSNKTHQSVWDFGIRDVKVEVLR